MINCVAIDDEPLALEVLKKYICKLPNLQLLMTFSDAIEAVAYLQKNQVDLLFLDIQMRTSMAFSFTIIWPINPW
jgi:two-component system LytT family response regulator